MISAPLPDFMPILPEITMAISAMLLLMVGVFLKKDAQNTVRPLANAAFLAVLALVLLTPQTRLEAFSGLFVSDVFSIVMKSLVLMGALVVSFASRRTVAQDGVDHFEYPVLMMLSTLGMMVMISANDLISLFIGLELQSLSLYVMTAMARKNTRASEAALKYFVLGALATGVLLYGCSLVYGFSGTTNFDSLERVFRGPEAIQMGAVIGFMFILAGLVFKISVVPFHMWTPDVYEGSPTSVTTFLAATPKIAGFALLMRVLMSPFFEMLPQWQMVLAGLAIATMVLGAFAALNQRNIKRLLAYSSIGHMGYALIGLVVGNEDGMRSSLIYMMLYLVMTMGAFACILNVCRTWKDVQEIKDLSGLARIRPGTAFIFGFLLFSMAGIPPMAGFLGKLYIFQSAVNAGFYYLAIIGVITSVVAAAYYLIVIKVMIMDQPTEAESAKSAKVSRDPVMSLVLGGVVASLILFFISPEVVIDIASAASASLAKF